MSDIPSPLPLMRRGQVVAWLGAHGFKAYEVRVLFETERIKPVRLRPTARAYYRREQIAQDILNVVK
jgi:hypothetical protein